MIEPMLCESITKEEIKNLKGNYKANFKYDGERIIAVKNGTDIFLFNRRGREKSFIYPEIVKELSLSPNSFIIDGEIITYDGVFNSLQKRVNLSDRRKITEQVKNNPVKFMVFDVLNVDGLDVRDKPLQERIREWYKISFALEKPFDIKVWFVEFNEIDYLLKIAEEKELEGIVIKNMDSAYQSRRSYDWLKCKNFKETELTLISYTENNAGIRCEDKEGIAVQVAGEQHRAVKKRIDEVGFCKVTIQYLEKTKENKFRFPSFRGLKC